MELFRILLLCLGAGGLTAAQTPAADPALEPLQKAYAALKAKDYDTAIASFQQALALAPARLAIRKDLAYALLKTGETEAARDQFSEAMRLDPQDQQVALEYAFLCYETKQPIEARRTFDRLRKSGNAAAEQAFQNIDRPLAEGIARWQKAVELEPANFSAHHELATLAEQRDELELAARHYEKAWRLRPEGRSLLVDLGRVWKQLGRVEQANAALLAASRGGEPRAAESARELLPNRYPYVYEFYRALDLDPENIGLRRELAYLHLAMGQRAEAEKQFEEVVKRAPEDLLSAAQLGFLRLSRKDKNGAMPLLDRVLKGNDDELADRVRYALGLPQTLRHRETPRRKVAVEAKQLAESSLAKSYMNDALKYLKVAHETDPVDFDVMLKMGWAYNILKQDEEAARWFSLARKSPDPAVASQASRAYNAVEPQFARFRTTAWLFPFYSSRWRDVFGYGQIKTEVRLGKFPLRPYFSVRFIGDTRQTLGSGSAYVQPQYLSENSFLIGFGVATPVWRGVMGWAEAAEAMRYLGGGQNGGAMVPDYRGGVSFTKGIGHLMGRESHGFFAETNDDGLYVSRFQNDMLLYSQNRTGYTLRTAESAGGFQAQLYWNWNLTKDWHGEYWANFVESGPGVRFRFHSLSASLLFSVNILRGAYLVREGNPRGPNFYDLRAGIWYAFTH